jgi:peptidoglycan/LPS O-acetylase OafA/YrhL
MNTQFSLTYRADIDGLRAVAVLAVVLFHIDHDLVPGGFAGVDMFFVISGYLITSLIYGQIRNNSFSFADFYRRRINRIIPALFGVIAGVSAIGLAILAPMDLMRLFTSAVYAAFATSNVFFWREYGNYFSSGVDEAPLLHTWSLGVEEQFYIVWPIALLLVSRLKPRIMFALMAFGLLVTVAISEFGVQNAASASYYLLPTRFFELLIGCALAIFVFHRGAPFGTYVSNVLGLAGLTLTLGSLFYLRSTSIFPGINALYPCAGTALLIAAGADSRSLTARLFALKPMVFIGLISYSLYLWHWPLIAYANYVGMKIGIVEGAAILVASMLIAWLSWRFVEMPFRRSGTGKSFASVLGLRYVVPAIGIIIASLSVIGEEGLPSRFDPRIGQYEKIIATAPNEIRANCHSPTLLYQRRPNDSCVLGAIRKPVDAILIGDSYANHFTGMVDVLAKQDDLSVMDYTMDGCMPVKSMGFGASATYAEKCKARNDFIYELITSHKYKYVILAASWPLSGTAEYFADFQRGMAISVETILSSGARPIIILNNQGTTKAECPIRRLLAGSSLSCDTAWESNDNLRKMFGELKRRFPAIVYVDPNHAICSDAICHSMIGNIPLYRDGGHLNDQGSRLIGKILVEKGFHLTSSDAGLRDDLIKSVH